MFRRLDTNDPYVRNMLRACKHMDDAGVIRTIIANSYEEDYLIFTSNEYEDFIEILDFSWWNMIFDRNVYELFKHREEDVKDYLDAFHEDYARRESYDNF